MDNSPSMLKATLIGGAVFGLIGATPFISALNCLCCSLVVAAGFSAAYIYSRDCQNQRAAFSAGNGAIVGLVAGMFYALTTVVVSSLVNIFLRTDIEEMLEQLEDSGFAIPPEAEPFFDYMIDASPILLFFLGFCFWLLIAAVFSTIGGLIGGAVFKFEPPAPPAAAGPPTIDVPPGGGDPAPPMT